MITKCKRKLSITIDEEIYQALDATSKSYNINKSQLAQKAFKLWLKKEIETMMAKGYEEMKNEDKAFADIAFEGQREILS